MNRYEQTTITINGLEVYTAQRPQVVVHYEENRTPTGHNRRQRRAAAARARKTQRAG